MRHDADPRASFDAFYRQHVRGIMAFCASRAPQAQDAADAVSETFMRALAGRERFDPAKGSGAAWLYGIALNVVRDQARGRSRARDLRERLGMERIVLSTADVAEYAELRADSRALLEAIAELPEAERALLLARQVGEVPYDDLTAAHGLDNAATARKRVSRTVAGLRDRLRREDRP